MIKRPFPMLLAALFVTASVLALITVPGALGGPDQQDATAQQQTINAVINERFTQTAAAGGMATQTAPPQGPTLTAAFEQTLDAAFSQALTATAQANTIQDSAGHNLEPLTPNTIMRLTEIAAFDVSGSISQLVFAPDSRSVFTAGGDRVVRQWDTATGAEIRQFAGHTEQIRGMALSPFGARLATSGDDDTIRLWNTANGEEIRSISTGDDVALDLAFSFDGSILAAGGRSGSISLWDIPSLALIRRFGAHTGAVRSLAFRPPNGELIGSVGEDGLAQLWNTSSGDPARTMGEEDAVLTAVAFRPDGAALAGAGRTLSPKVWTLSETIALGSPDDYDAIAYSPDGQLIITASTTSAGLRVWNPATGALIVARELNAPVFDAAFSPNGFLIATGGANPKLWGVVPGVIPTPEPTPLPTATRTPVPIETLIALDTTATHQATLIQQETQAAAVTPTPRPAGFPTDVSAELALVQQSYEHGWMFWLRHNRQIWVATLDVSGIFGGEWFCYYDTFEEGDPEIDPSLSPPEGLIQPHRGFGKVWREHPDIRELLGWATTPEFEHTSAYTYLAGGTIDANGTFVAGPGEHRITTFGGDRFSFFEEAIRGDCIGGTWHQTR